jgi:type I restriction enzyme M protein
VFSFIKNELSKENEPFAKAMQDAVFIINKSSLLKDVMEFINVLYIDIDNEIKNNNQHFNDIQGDIYEHLLKHTNEAGKNGQFRTPRHIIAMMAEILDPDLDGRICDIACGTGGFLVGAYQYIITKHSKIKTKDDDGLQKSIDGLNLSKSQQKKLKENTFFGFDIDQTMIRIGVMNLMMHGILKPDIENLDTLSTKYEEIEAERLSIKLDTTNRESLANPNLQGQYKYILANPPFTGKIDDLGISDNIDRTFPPKYSPDGIKQKQPVQSELLFLERIIYMLEEGGRAAVIVPEGVLFNSGRAHKTIRKILMTDCSLEGVISLPSGVFQPYTGVKTSILIFEKRKFKNGLNNPQTTDVWFYGMTADGYSLDSTRKRLKTNPLPETVNAWKERKSSSSEDRKGQHFRVPYTEIEENDFELNFNLYKDFVYEPINYEAPIEIYSRIETLEKEIIERLSELK